MNKFYGILVNDSSRDCKLCAVTTNEVDCEVLASEKLYKDENKDFSAIMVFEWCATVSREDTDEYDEPYDMFDELNYNPYMGCEEW